MIFFNSTTKKQRGCWGQDVDVCAFVLQKNLYFKVEKTSQKKVSYKNFQFLLEITSPSLWLISANPGK